MRTRPPTSIMLALAAIFAVALGLRLAWILNTDTETPPLSDPQYYHATAVNIADGRGYGVAVGDTGFESGGLSEATAFWAPGYSFTLGAAYAAFGNDDRVAKVVNAIAGALLVLPCYFIAQRLARASGATDTHAHIAGCLAGAIVAVLPALVYWTPALFSEPLFTLAAASTLSVALIAADADRFGRRTATLTLMALAGLMLAASMMIRSQAVVLVIPIAILVVRIGDPLRSLRMFAPLAAAVALVVVPWTIRNEATMGRAYAINNSLCYNLRIGHAPNANGTSVPPQDLWDEQAGISFKQRELLFDDVGCGRAWDYAREHPGREAELSARKIGWMIRSDAADAVRWSESLGATPLHRGDRDGFVLLGDVAWYALIGVAALSLPLLPNTRTKWALWSLVAGWLLMHVAFHGEPRYHVPLTPALTALAAGVICWSGSRMVRWRVR